MASYLPLSPVSFFFTDTATTEIYTLSLHDALPICWSPFLCQFGFTEWTGSLAAFPEWDGMIINGKPTHAFGVRSEEHTSELQSHSDLVCRLLLEKKNMRNTRGIRR